MTKVFCFCSFLMWVVYFPMLEIINCENNSAMGRLLCERLCYEDYCIMEAKVILKAVMSPPLPILEVWETILLN